MAQWYAVQAKARQENIAEQNLLNQGYTTYLPQLRTVRHRRGRWQPIIEPLFPGYLFVELELGEQNIAPIRSTRGVISLVRCAGQPQSIPCSIIDTLRKGETDAAIEPANLFKPGDQVQLIDGPMAGLTAIFKAQSSQERVVIMLNMLGTEATASVSPHQLAKVG